MLKQYPPFNLLLDVASVQCVDAPVQFEHEKLKYEVIHDGASPEQASCIVSQTPNKSFSQESVNEQIRANVTPLPAVYEDRRFHHSLLRPQMFQTYSALNVDLRNLRDLNEVRQLLSQAKSKKCADTRPNMQQQSVVSTDFMQRMPRIVSCDFAVGAPSNVDTVHRTNEVFPKRKLNNSTSPKSLKRRKTSTVGYIDEKTEQDILRWYERFNELAQYKQENGDCLVPQHYDKNPSLGMWVSNQRRLKSRSNKSALVLARMKALDEIGFCWNTKVLTKNKKILKRN